MTLGLQIALILVIGVIVFAIWIRGAIKVDEKMAHAENYKLECLDGNYRVIRPDGDRAAFTNRDYAENYIKEQVASYSLWNRYDWESCK